MYRESDYAGPPSGYLACRAFSVGALAPYPIYRTLLSILCVDRTTTLAHSPFDGEASITFIRSLSSKARARAILAPAALAFLAAVVHDGIPVVVGLFLVVGGDLEGERLGLPEGAAAFGWWWKYLGHIRGSRFSHGCAGLRHTRIAPGD